MVKKFGTKDEVFQGLAMYTKGKLTKEDLVLNRRGVPVSKKRSELGKQRIQQLQEMKQNLSKSKDAGTKNNPIEIKEESEDWMKKPSINLVHQQKR